MVTEPGREPGPQTPVCTLSAPRLHGRPRSPRTADPRVAATVSASVRPSRTLSESPLGARLSPKPQWRIRQMNGCPPGACLLVHSKYHSVLLTPASPAWDLEDV